MSSEVSGINRLRLAFSNLSRNLQVPWNPVFHHDLEKNQLEHKSVEPELEQIKRKHEDFEKASIFLENIEELASQWISAEHEMRSLGERLTRSLEESVFFVHESSTKTAARLLASTLEEIMDANQRSSECVTEFLRGVAKVSSGRSSIAAQSSQLIELESAQRQTSSSSIKSADPHLFEMQNNRERFSAERSSLMVALSQAERTMEIHLSKELAVFVKRQTDSLRNAAEVFTRLQAPLAQIQNSLPIIAIEESMDTLSDPSLRVAPETAASNGGSEILQLLSAPDFSFAMVIAEVRVTFSSLCSQLLAFELLRF